VNAMNEERTKTNTYS